MKSVQIQACFLTPKGAAGVPPKILTMFLPPKRQRSLKHIRPRRARGRKHAPACKRVNGPPKAIRSRAQSDCDFFQKIRKVNSWGNQFSSLMPSIRRVKEGADWKKDSW